MALRTVSFDAATKISGSGTTVSGSHTGTGDILGAVILVHVTSGGSITGVTYAGIDCTDLGGGGNGVSWWAAVSTPNGLPSGSQTVEAAFDASASAQVHVLTCTHVKQNDPWRDKDNLEFGGGDGKTFTLTTESGDMVIGALGFNHDTSGIPGIAWPQGTERTEHRSGDFGTGTATEPAVGTSTSVEWSLGVAANGYTWSGAVALQPQQISGSRAFMMPFINAREKWNEIFGNGRVEQDGLWKPQPGILTA